MNQVILMGRLTRDPELRTTPNGKNVCSFSLAVDRAFGQDDAADFFDVTAWDKLGELVNQYLAKGRRCLVQGRLSQRSWEQDGQKRSKVEVIATDVTFLDSAQGGGDGGGNASRSSNSSSQKSDDVVIEDIDDKPIDLSEIPF
ncbi:single-stranded DNA-binding protein [Candidatus Saccharibacteria bacterium]|nr:MAG: single-stranded DNA-binding protein [Candidatus Saccharibacteria bacterium]